MVDIFSLIKIGLAVVSDHPRGQRCKDKSCLSSFHLRSVNTSVQSDESASIFGSPEFEMAFDVWKIFFEFFRIRTPLMVVS